MNSYHYQSIFLKNKIGNILNLVLAIDEIFCKI